MKKVAKPYIKQVETIGNYTVWIVDGPYIRQHIDEEFTSCGQHFRFNFIPLNELWIDKERVPGEQEFYIQHLLIEHTLMSQNVSYEKALEKADRAEKKERNKIDFIQKNIQVNNKIEKLSLIYKELLKSYSKYVEVWVVSGRYVRDLFFIDFTEGGHDKVYKFIPHRQVWIDDDVELLERKFIILHELHERQLMAKGSNYADAHAAASRLEFYCRNNRAELQKHLNEAIKQNK